LSGMLLVVYQICLAEHDILLFSRGDWHLHIFNMSMTYFLFNNAFLDQFVAFCVAFCELMVPTLPKVDGATHYLGIVHTEKHFPGNTVYTKRGNIILQAEQVCKPYIGGWLKCFHVFTTYRSSCLLSSLCLSSLCLTWKCTEAAQWQNGWAKKPPTNQAWTLRCPPSKSRPRLDQTWE
jgi:hypothetical protein